MRTLLRRHPLVTAARNLARDPQQLERLVRSKWMLCRNFPRPRSHRLPAPLHVTLTSYPARFGALATTLKCLLMQTCPADSVVLWIAEADLPQLPKEVLALRPYGVEIRTCAELRSYKKIIPPLRENPQFFWVTADDDCYYPPNWLETMVAAWAPYAREVICHRAHRIRTDEQGLPLPYREWELELTTQSSHPLNFMTGVGGVLYPPGCFATEVLQEDVFTELCPACDDVWLWWMLRRQGYWVRKIGGPWTIIDWPDSQTTSLYQQNVLENGNDIAIANLVAYYGFPGQHATHMSAA